MNIPPNAQDLINQMTQGSVGKVMEMAQKSTAFKWSGKEFKNFKEMVDFLEDRGDIINLSLTVVNEKFYLLYARR